MKKIVFLRTNPNATGGAERYLSRLQKYLQSNHIQSELRSFNGNLKMSSWKKALKFNSQAKREKKDNELYFSLERITCADIYRAGDGVHKVYMKTKPFWFLNLLNFVYPYLEKRCFKNSKKIIANSNFVKEQIISTYGVNENKIITIYNGINLPTKIEKGSAKLALCNEFGLDYDLPIVLFVGNGFKRKGASEFLRIVSELKTPVNSIIVGKDKNFKNYKQRAKKLGVKTFFAGMQRTTAKFYEAADIFLFPTYYEPFSNVVLEALSYGCAVFTTKQNGASEILEEDFIMSSPQEVKIYKKIDEILSDNNYLRTVQLKNLELSKNFTIEKNANLTMEVINEYIH